MRLSAGIMAHPDRADLVSELSAALDRPVPVFWDSGGKPSGHGDRVWAVARQTWLMADPEADWHVLIQDDAVVCADFLAGLESALVNLPTTWPAVVCPYLGQGRTVPRRWGQMARRADQLGASWVRSDRVMWGVCLALPTKTVPEMVAWCDRRVGMPDDMRIAAWAQRHGWGVWYPWPSLVDHRPVPSLTKHRAADRRAQRHHAGSALELSWTGPTVTDRMYVRRRGPRSGPTGAWRTAVAP